MGLLILLITIILCTLIFQKEYIFRREYIETLSKKSLPEASEIIEYNVGSGRFYAKVKIDKDTYNLWKMEYSVNEQLDIMEQVVRRKAQYGYQSLEIEAIEERAISELLTAEETGFFINCGGRTRSVYTIITKESTELYCFYVLY